MFLIVLILVIAVAWGLIVLVHKANVAFGDEKAATEGTKLGGCLTFIIIVAAIAFLNYFWDLMGKGYDLSSPFRM